MRFSKLLLILLGILIVSCRKNLPTQGLINSGTKRPDTTKNVVTITNSNPTIPLLGATNPNFKTQIEGQTAVDLNPAIPYLSSQYLAYVPKGYNSKPNGYWPTIIFLHGSGERGTNINLVKKNGPPKFLDTAKNFNFLVFSPQCPYGIFWNYQNELHDYMKQIESIYNVDTTKIYLTGLSAGGYGTWDWAEAYPKDFTAIVPVSGAGNVSQSYKIKTLPIWVFHGLLDNTVSIQSDSAMVKSLSAQGADIQFTVFPNGGHDIWDATYQNPALYKWMLKYKKH
jgi:predicted peptidase